MSLPAFVHLIAFCCVDFSSTLLLPVGVVADDCLAESIPGVPLCRHSLKDSLSLECGLRQTRALGNS